MMDLSRCFEGTFGNAQVSLVHLQFALIDPLAVIWRSVVVLVDAGCANHRVFSVYQDYYTVRPPAHTRYWGY